MKLSVCTGELELRFGIERSFEMIKNAGFDAVDFNLVGNWNGTQEETQKMRCYGMSEFEIRKYFEKIRGAAEKYGLEVGQTHSIYGTRGFFTDRETYEKITISNIFQTHLLGCSHTVIHPIKTPARILDEGYDECYRLNIEFYRSIIPYLDKYNVKAAIEPMWAFDAQRNIRSTVCSRPEEILSLIEDLGGEHFCACPDFGHIELVKSDTGNTVGDVLRKLGKTVEIVHAHEITKNLDAHTKPYTYGGMDWDDIGTALKEIDYKGNLNFEIGNNYFSLYPDNLIPDALRHLSEIGKSIVK